MVPEMNRPTLPLHGSVTAAPVTYHVRHLTSYRYNQPVTRDYARAYIEPRATENQRILMHGIHVSPEPSSLSTHTDFYGNSSTYFLVDGPHTYLDVTSEAHVQVEPRSYPAEALAAPWERCASAQWSRVIPAQFHDFTRPSARVYSTDAIARLAKQIFTPGRPVGECLVDLTSTIYTEFTYAPLSTTVSSPLEEVMATQQGVCQDFAHVALAVARHVGLAARYVSGYLRTTPDKPAVPLDASDASRVRLAGDVGGDVGGNLAGRTGAPLTGAAASHAWLSVFVPTAGWVDIDPTNNTAADQRFVTTAWGRDYDDVPPLRGVIVGPTGITSELTVAVDVVPTDLECSHRP